MGRNQDETRLPLVQKFTLYKRRWVILAVFSLISFTNEALWINLSSITSIVKVYYKVDSNSVNWLSMIFFVLFVFVVAALYISNRFGLKFTIVIGAVLNGLGSCLRCIGANRDGFVLVFLGNTSASFAQCFLLFIPPRLAAVWFGEHERATASSIGVLMNMFGIAGGFLMGIMVPNSPDMDYTVHRGMTNQMIYQAVVCTLLVLFSVLFIKDAPPTPPSKSQALLLQLQNKERMREILKGEVVWNGSLDSMENGGKYVNDHAVNGFEVLMLDQGSSFEEEKSRVIEKNLRNTEENLVIANGHAGHSKEGEVDFQVDGRTQKENGRNYKDSGRDQIDHGRNYNDLGHSNKVYGHSYKDSCRNQVENGRNFKENGRNYKKIDRNNKENGRIVQQHELDLTEDGSEVNRNYGANDEDLLLESKRMVKFVTEKMQGNKGKFQTKEESVVMDILLLGSKEFRVKFSKNGTVLENGYVSQDKKEILKEECESEKKIVYERIPDFRESMWILAKFSSFHLLCQAYAIYYGLNCAYNTILNEMITSRYPGKEKQIGYLGFISNFVGVLAMFFCGVWLDRTKRYRKLSLWAFGTCALSMLIFTLLLSYDNHFFIMFMVFCVFSVFSYPFLSVGLEYAAEIAYPISEGITSCVLLLFGNLYSVIFTMVLWKANKIGGAHFAGYIMFFFYLLSLCFIYLINASLKRSEAEKPVTISTTYSSL